MTKLFSKTAAKITGIFFLALLIGLWSGGLFERYIFSFGLVPVFSAAEIQRLNGKTVSENCYRQDAGKKKIGKVVGYSRHGLFFSGVRVVWDDKDAGRWIEYPKSYFSECIEVEE